MADLVQGAPLCERQTAPGFRSERETQRDKRAAAVASPLRMARLMARLFLTLFSRFVPEITAWGERLGRYEGIVG